MATTIFATATLQLLQLLAAASVLLSDPQAAAASSPQTQIGSGSRCGNISLPNPFALGTGAGAGAGGGHRDGFKLLCNETYDPPKLFLGSTGVEVLEIAIQDGTIRIDGGILSITDDLTDLEWTVAELNGSLYTVSELNNVAVLGCGFSMQWTVPVGGIPGEGPTTTCVSSCAAGGGHDPAMATDGTCSGIGCCHAAPLQVCLVQ